MAAQACAPWRTAVAARLLAAALLLLGTASLAAAMPPASRDAAGGAVLAPRNGFWHYSLLEEERSAMVEVRLCLGPAICLL